MQVVVVESRILGAWAVQFLVCGVGFEGWSRLELPVSILMVIQGFLKRAPLCFKVFGGFALLPRSKRSTLTAKPTTQNYTPA